MNLSTDLNTTELNDNTDTLTALNEQSISHVTASTTNSHPKVAAVNSYNVLLHSDDITPLSPSKTRTMNASYTNNGPRDNGIGYRINGTNAHALPKYRVNPSSKSLRRRKVGIRRDKSSGVRRDKYSRKKLGNHRTKVARIYSSINGTSLYRNIKHNRSQSEASKTNKEFDEAQENSKIIREATRLLVTRNDSLKALAKDSKAERAAKHLLTIGSTTLKIAKCLNNKTKECTKEHDGGDEKNKILQEFFKLHSDDTRIRLIHRLTEIGRAAMVKGKELQKGLGEGENSDLRPREEEVYETEAERKGAKLGKKTARVENLHQNKNKDVVVKEKKADKPHQSTFHRRQNHTVIHGVKSGFNEENRSVAKEAKPGLNVSHNSTRRAKSKQGASVDESYASHLERALQNVSPTYHKTALCSHGKMHRDVIPRFGLHSGLIVLHGVVKNLDRCIKYCCASHTCDLAMLVKKECFTITCKSKFHCQFVQNRGHRRIEAVRIYRGKVKYKTMLENSFEAESIPINSTVSHNKIISHSQRATKTNSHHHKNYSFGATGRSNSSVTFKKAKITSLSTEKSKHSGSNSSFAVASRNTIKSHNASGGHSKLEASKDFNMKEGRNYGLKLDTRKVSKIEHPLKNFVEEEPLKYPNYNVKMTNMSTLHSEQLMATKGLTFDKSAPTDLLPKHVSKNFTSSVKISLTDKHGSTPNPLYNKSFLLKFYGKTQDRAESYRNVLSLENIKTNLNGTDTPMHYENKDNETISKKPVEHSEIKGRKKHHARMRSRMKGKKHSKHRGMLQDKSKKSIAKNFKAMISEFMKPHQTSKQAGLDALLHAEMTSPSLDKNANGVDEINGFRNSMNRSRGSLVDRPQIAVLGTSIRNKNRASKHMENLHGFVPLRDKYLNRDDVVFEKTPTVVEPMKPMTSKPRSGLIDVKSTENRVGNATLRSMTYNENPVAIEAHKDITEPLVSVIGGKRGGVSVSSKKVIETKGESNNNELIPQDDKPSLAPSSGSLPSSSIPVIINSSSLPGMTNIMSKSQNGEYNQILRNNLSRVSYEKPDSRDIMPGKVLPTLSKSEANYQRTTNLKPFQALHSNKTMGNVTRKESSMHPKISDSHQTMKNHTFQKQQSRHGSTAGISHKASAYRYNTAKKTGTNHFLDIIATKKQRKEKEQSSFSKNNPVAKPSLKEELVGEEKRNLTQKDSLKIELDTSGIKGRKENSLEPASVQLVEEPSNGKGSRKANLSSIRHVKMAESLSAKERTADHQGDVSQNKTMGNRFVEWKPSKSSRQQHIKEILHRLQPILPITNTKRPNKAANRRKETVSIGQSTKQSVNSSRPRNVHLKNEIHPNKTQITNKNQTTTEIILPHSTKIALTGPRIHPTKQTQKTTVSQPINHQSRDFKSTLNRTINYPNPSNISHITKKPPQQNDTTFVHRGNTLGLARADITNDVSKIYQNLTIVGHEERSTAKALDKTDNYASKHKSNVTNFVIKHGRKHAGENSTLPVSHQNATNISKYITEHEDMISSPTSNRDVTTNATGHAKQSSGNIASQKVSKDNEITVNQTHKVIDVNYLSRHNNNGSHVYNNLINNKTRNATIVAVSHQKDITTSFAESSNKSLPVEYLRPISTNKTMSSTSLRPIWNSSSVTMKPERQRQSFENLTLHLDEITEVSLDNASSLLSKHKSSTEKSSSFIPEKEAIPKERYSEANYKLEANKTGIQNSSFNVNKSHQLSSKNYSRSSAQNITIHTQPNISYPVATRGQNYSHNRTYKATYNHLAGRNTTYIIPTHLEINHTKPFKLQSKNSTIHAFEKAYSTSTSKVLRTSRIKHKHVVDRNFNSKNARLPYWPQEYFPWRNYQHPTSKATINPVNSNTSTLNPFYYKRLFWKSVPGQSPYWLQYQHLAQNLTENAQSRPHEKTDAEVNDRITPGNSSNRYNKALREKTVENVKEPTGNHSKNTNSSIHATGLRSNNTTRAVTSYMSGHLNEIEGLNVSSIKPLSSSSNKTSSSGIKNVTSEFRYGPFTVNRTATGEQINEATNDKAVDTRPKVQIEHLRLNHTAFGLPYSVGMQNYSHAKTENGSKRVFASDFVKNLTEKQYQSHEKTSSGVEQAIPSPVSKLNKTEQFLNTVQKSLNPDLTIRVHYKLGKTRHRKQKRPNSNETTGIHKSKTPKTIRVYYNPGKAHAKKKAKQKVRGKSLKVPDTIKVYYNPGRYALENKVTDDKIRNTGNKSTSSRLTEFYGIKKLYMKEDSRNKNDSVISLDNEKARHKSNGSDAVEATATAKEMGSPPDTDGKSPYKFMIYVPQDSVDSSASQNSDHTIQKTKAVKTSTGAKKSFHRNESDNEIFVTSKHSFHRKKTDSKHCNLLGLYTDKVLHEGVKAGNFYTVLFVKDPVHCHKKCCADQRCNFAMFFRDFCYLIECFSKQSCRIVQSKANTRHPHLLAKIREPETRSLSSIYKFPPEIGLTHVPTMFIRPKSATVLTGEKRQSKSQKEKLLDLFHSLLNQIESRHPTSKREYVKGMTHFEAAMKDSNVTFPNVTHDSTNLFSKENITSRDSKARNEKLPLFARPFFGMPLNKSIVQATNQSDPSSDYSYLTDYLNETFANVSKPFHPTNPSRVKFVTTQSASKHPTLHAALSNLSSPEIKKIVAALARELSQVNLKLKDVLPELKYVLSHSRSKLSSSCNVSATIFNAIKALRASELKRKVSKLSGYSKVPVAHNISRLPQDIDIKIKTSKTSNSQSKGKQTVKQESKASKAAEQLINSVKDIDKPRVDQNSRLTCIITSVRGGATLYGGPRSGVFTSHGGGLSLNDCIERCCTADNCHVALLVAGHCYTVKCYTAALCRIVPMTRAGHYLMTVAYVRRRITYSTGKQGRLLTAIGDTSLPLNAIVCAESVVYEGYTLKGGYDAGHFTYKGEVSTLTDCIELCCNANFCDLVFMVTNQCYLVYCYGKDGCQHVKAYHGVLYRTRIAYLHSRSKIIPPWTPKDIELRGVIKGMKKTADHDNASLNNGRPKSPASIQPVQLITPARRFPINPQFKNWPSEKSITQSCLRTKILKQTTMAKGHLSGKLLFRGRKSDDRDCVRDCCLNDKCNIAMIVRDYCFNVVCKSKAACKPVKATKSKHSIRLAVIRTSITTVDGMIDFQNLVYTLYYYAYELKYY